MHAQNTHTKRETLFFDFYLMIMTRFFSFFLQIKSNK